MLKTVIDAMKEEFQSGELVNDERINSLGDQLILKLQEIYKVNKELSKEIDEICAEMALAYVECCFDNGVKYGLKLKNDIDSL